MHSNYLNNKENTYRHGVLEGNYVEEIYSRDFLRSTVKEPRVLISETREKFVVIDNGTTIGQSKNSDGLCTDNPNATINSVGKKCVNGDADENYNDVDAVAEEGEVETKSVNPGINYLQSYKRLIDAKDGGDEFGHCSKKVNSAKKTNYDGLATHLFLNHGLETERPLNEEFLTTYNICYDMQIKPQEVVDNNVKSANLLSKTRLNETVNKAAGMGATMDQSNDIKAFSKKEQDFTRAFDKPHMTIGFRN